MSASTAQGWAVISAISEEKFQVCFFFLNVICQLFTTPVVKSSVSPKEHSKELVTLFRKTDRKRLSMDGGSSLFVQVFFLSWGWLSFGIKQCSRAELIRALQQRQEAGSRESRGVQLPAGGSIQQPKSWRSAPAAGTGREPRQHPTAAEPTTDRCRTAALPLSVRKGLAIHCFDLPFLLLKTLSGYEAIQSCHLDFLPVVLTFPLQY